MERLVIEFFERQGEILVFHSKEKKLNSIIYKFSYTNYKSINKLNLIIKSLKSFLNQQINFVFNDGVLEIEIKSNNNIILPFENYFSKIPKNQNNIFFGVDNNNKPIYYHISKMKSLLIGGSSGSGKSNLIHQLILSIILLNKDIYLLMIDMKGNELTRYNFLAKKNRLIRKVSTEKKDALKTIILFYTIIKKRFKKMQRQKERLSKENPIVLIIDEYAQLFSNNKEKKIINEYVSKIGALGRACNCYLILATQHPTNENINNTIRANLQSRIALKCQSIQQSRNIINSVDATQLVNSGDLILWLDGCQPLKLRCSFVSDNLLNKFEKANS